MPKREIIAGYIPVIHKGYMRFFAAYPQAKECYVLSESTLAETDYIRKDIRALSVKEQMHVLAGLDRFDVIRELNDTSVKALDTADTLIHMPDEDVSRDFAQKHIKKASVEYYPIFLRWDRTAVTVDAVDENEDVISEVDFDKTMMQEALREAGHSPDIWRRVGAILVQDKDITARAHNQPEPTQHSASIEGDPRNIFSRGVGIEMSVFTHAEAKLIASAAKEGLRLEGASMYVTTYPCPACAKLIAHSGIKNCYYAQGYAVLDGRRVLEDYGVNIFRVDAAIPENPGPEALPYKNTDR